MNTREEFIEKAYLTKKSVMEQINQKRIKYNWHEADVSVIEGVLARGDRRLAPVLEKVYQKGCIFDAWSEYFHYDLWLEAMAECGLSPDFYTTRERSTEEILPWDFLDCGVNKEFLKREWKRALAGEVSPNCRSQCQGCGAAGFGTGVCVEAKGGMA
jgi:hypothetical protein